MTQRQIDHLTLQERLVAPTPKFFQKLKIVGISIAAVASALLAAPVTLPSIVVTIAGYLAVTGSVINAVSQATVES